jgi:hypothetical protein
MGVGADLKDALREIGVLVTWDTNPTGEYVQLKANEAVKQSFLQEFVLDAVFPFDTSIQPGDVVYVPIMDTYYLCMSRLVKAFENEVIKYITRLYKCNITSGELMRPSQSSYNSQYKKTLTFPQVYTSIKACQTDVMAGIDKQEMDIIGLDKDELYISSVYETQQFDRFQSASGEYYMVDSVIRRRFNGVDICKLVPDTR